MFVNRQTIEAAHYVNDQEQKTAKIYKLKKQIKK